MPDLLLDTNVLLLLLIGTWDRHRITSFRRTDIFTEADFDLLQDQRQHFASHVTTATVLSEASNLIGSDLHHRIATTMITVIDPFEERVASMRDVFADPAFRRIGFSDATILLVAGAQTTILTTDVQLYLEAGNRGLSVINFNHLRTTNC